MATKWKEKKDWGEGIPSEGKTKKNKSFPRGHKIERYKGKKLGRGGGGEKTQSVPRGLYMWPQNEERKCLKIVAKI